MRVFFAAELLGPEEFLEADDLRAAVRRFAGASYRLFEILAGIGRAGHLHETDTKVAGVSLILRHLYHCISRATVLIRFTHTF